MAQPKRSQRPKAQVQPAGDKSSSGAAGETCSGSPAAAPPSRWTSWLTGARLAAAIVATVSLLPYAWGRSLVIYSQWEQIDQRHLSILVVGLAAVMLLNFNQAAKLRSKRFAWRILAAVVVLWVGFSAAAIVANNGDVLPHWAVFAGFFPATLWVLWCAWMLFMPIRWSVRIGALAALVAAIGPWLYFFEVRDLAGDARVNFALKSRAQRPRSFGSSIARFPVDAFQLVADSKADFPGFQGGDRNAVLPNVRLDRDWASRPPRELWRVPVGAGLGGFAVVGGYAFTQEQRGAEECVVCRRLADGKEVWLHADKAPYKGQPAYFGMGGPGPRCTPAVYEGRVYTVGATGIFNCLDGSTGDVVWSHNIVEENGGSVAEHGVCGSPLIVGQLVIVAPTGKPEISLAAYDRVSGKLAWCKGYEEAGYASPMLARVAGVEQILNYTRGGVTAHNSADGSVLWHYDWTNNEKEVSSQPVAPAGKPDQVLLSVGYGKGSVLLKIGRGADGAWSATPIWESRNMKTKFTTAVVRDGYVYGLDDGIMQCIDLKTGKQKWKGGRYQHGQILLAGDLILVQTEQPGSVVLVDPSPNKLIELGRIPALSSKTWNCPTLAGKHLLVRNDVEAACYEVRLRDEKNESTQPAEPRKPLSF